MIGGFFYMSSEKWQVNMALGGGSYTFTNKALPGSYINFVSTSLASGYMSDRGTAAVVMPLPWGPVGELMTLTSSDFYNNSLGLLGRSYTHDDLMGLRELFKYAQKCYILRAETGGSIANCDFGTAKYEGELGNSIMISVSISGARFIVKTYLDGSLRDSQTVSSAEGLENNSFVDFDTSASLYETAGIYMAGGADGTVKDEIHQKFLGFMESYQVNAIGCVSDDDLIKGLYADFTVHMRDETGVKLQCVLYRYTQADSEGVISVENCVGGDEGDPSAVYWVTGATAGCALNRSNTNRLYDGELNIYTDYSQLELEEFVVSGSFVFHNVSGDIRVLEDINTFVSFASDKSEDFSRNQTIRVLDQVAMDIAATFNTKYLGQISNNSAGRISLWNDIVAHHRQLETVGAIEDFSPDFVTVDVGETKRSVVVTDLITPVSAMSQLYMTVVVE